MKLTIEIQTGDRGEILAALHGRIRVCERMALQLETVSVATARLYRTEIEHLERIERAILHAELIDT